MNFWFSQKIEHKRTYTGAEEAERRSIFEENRSKNIEHNEKYKRGEVTWMVGLNLFSDRKPEELRWMHGVRMPSEPI